MSAIHQTALSDHPSRSTLARCLCAIGLMAPQIKPAVIAELDGRVEILAKTRLKNLVLPPDLEALYKQRTRRASRTMMAAWSAAIGWLNLLLALFDFLMVPQTNLTHAIECRIFITVMYLFCSHELRQRRLAGMEHFLVIIPAVITCVIAGIIGTLDGTPDLFANNFTMAVTVAYTGIMFVNIDLSYAAWMGALTILVLSAFTVHSPLPNIPEKAEFIFFHASIMAAMLLARRSQNLHNYRMFLWELVHVIQSNEVERRNQQLSSIAYTDRLTDIPNRRYFEEIADAINAAPEHSLPLAICMFDIDHFKNLNDQLGHTQGDRCLRVVAAAMRNNLRQKSDILARYGGEEFILVLPNTTALQALEVVERIRLAVLTLNHPNPGTELDRVTISAGLATTTEPTVVEPLLQQADKALYRAKTNGRNRVNM
jgi:diguanylate cyclase (GGDEF)-like protein